MWSDYHTRIENQTGKQVSVQQMMKMISGVNRQDPEEENKDTSLFIDYYVKTGLSKVEEGCQFMSLLLDNDAKFLWYVHHKSVLTEYENYLKKNKVNYLKIDGSTRDKGWYIFFQNDPKIKVALLSITAAYQGITMTASSIVVFAEYYWTPGVMTQAEDRVHRVSQTQKVTIYYLHCNDSLDLHMSKYILNKDRVTSNALDNKSSDYRYFNHNSVKINS